MTKFHTQTHKTPRKITVLHTSRLHS